MQQQQREHKKESFAQPVARSTMLGLPCIDENRRRNQPKIEVTAPNFLISHARQFVRLYCIGTAVRPTLPKGQWCALQPNVRKPL
ncbi:hypothetical protein M0802_014977 [Mischocyttarus mexicanus]|nr:hypothetical protein M0802_014977 [Mischocyttarus mexicanus]